MERYSPEQSSRMAYIPNLCPAVQEEPRDLSMKRRIRTVPPPLDLTIKTLDIDHSLAPSFSPRSPASQKYLPLRKRTLSWSSHLESYGLTTHSEVASHCQDAQSQCSTKWSCLPTPQTPTHPSSAVPLSSSKFVFGDQNLHQPLNLSTGSMNLPSSMLSPAPSHLSSSPLSSSREELEPESHNVNSNYERMDVDNRCHKKLSIWSIFESSVQIYFLNGNHLSNPRVSDELAQFEKAHPHQRYAPQGLKLIQILQAPNKSNNFGQLFLKPIPLDHPGIVAVVPSDHLFYVKSRGWCSLAPEIMSEKLSGGCQYLQEGDHCLPRTHPDAAHTPIPVLTDAMQKFDFSDDTAMDVMQATTTSTPYLPNQRFQFLSPPASPSKKKTEGGKSRRPMNGFMLYAKEHRLKLIQQFPGKDNRAISVLLGTMWKSLDESERDVYNGEARQQAEQRKRVDPDCWKRKRSNSTS